MPVELWINNVTESKWENGLNIGIAIANNEKNYKTCLVILHGHITNRPSDLCHFKIQQKKETKPTSLKVYILRISLKYLCITQHKIFLVGGYDHNLLGGLFSKCSVDQIEDTR